jgi:hypothetical protein
LVVCPAVPCLGPEVTTDPTKTFVAMSGAIRQGCGNNS